MFYDLVFSIKGHIVLVVVLPLRNRLIELNTRFLQNSFHLYRRHIHTNTILTQNSLQFALKVLIDLVLILFHNVIKLGLRQLLDNLIVELLYVKLIFLNRTAHLFYSFQVLFIDLLKVLLCDYEPI